MDKVAKVNWNSVAASIIGSTAAMTLGFFIDEIFESLKKLRIKAKSREYFEKMLEAHPQLKKEDPTIVAQYWASLYHYAPFMAEDPLSAGAFIRQSIDRGFPDLYGGPPIDTYNTLSNIQKQISDSRSKTKRRFTDAAEKATENLLSKTLEKNTLSTFRG